MIVKLDFDEEETWKLECLAKKHNTSVPVLINQVMSEWIQLKKLATKVRR